MLMMQHTGLCIYWGSAAVAHEDANTACSRYARRVGAQFNYSPDKTVAMSLLGSPPPLEEQIDCSLVKLYRLLGCLTDDGLAFVRLLKDCLGRARPQFAELFHAAESGGFSVHVLAQQVGLRVEPGILYVAPLLFLATGMATAMAKLQAAWARNI